MQQLLLMGAGHAHAFVLEAFAEQPEPSIAITVVSDSPLAAYSGSVPTWLSSMGRTSPSYSPCAH